jgi:4-hydroxybenzoate polyprenyltransferase/phosphoserine phosphatase
MSSAPELTFAATQPGIPLVVDLDGTLVRTDLLVEAAFAHLGAAPLRCFGLLRAALRGRAALKARIAAVTDLGVTELPYDEDVLSLIRQAKRDGRPVFLASASHERYVGKVANHLGLFDGWFGSSHDINLTAGAKALRLAEAFGRQSFDYVGNDRADLPVWVVARRRIAVRASASVRARLQAVDREATFLPNTSDRFPAWLRLLRVHQWSKNLLVLVPLLTGHWFTRTAFAQSAGAFFAFSLAASSIYIFNDLVDIEADRRHPTKRQRPLAAGTLPIVSAVLVAPLLLSMAMALAFWVSALFGGVLCLYVALSTAYTFSIKRKIMVDVIALAALYTLRVLGGSAAIGAMPSEWILGFSMFIFTTMALIKRYVELATRMDAGLPDPSNRNYRKSDLSVIAALAAGAGFNAVTVFAIYISSDAARHLYRHPLTLWLICPVLMYWLARALIVAHRRAMHDDPIVFALRDRNSLLAFGLIGLIMLVAL